MENNVTINIDVEDYIEMLEDRIDIANMQTEYLMSVIREEIPLDYLEEIELELQRIEEEYYKYEED